MHTPRRFQIRTVVPITLIALLALSAACAPRKPKTTAAAPPPQPAPIVADVPADTSSTVPPPPTSAPPRTLSVDNAQPLAPRIEEDSVAARSLEDLNRNSLLQPAFFPLDSSDLDEHGRATVSANADILKKYASWMVTVEGHADERGTAEYNLALGERRASAVKTYLVTLGIPADRLRTISYGKEFPFAPDHDEAAWAKNRRAHFVITAK